MNAALPKCAIVLGLVVAMFGGSVQAAEQSDAIGAVFNERPQVTDIELSVEVSTQYANASGEALIRLMHDRHQQYPYVYEEQSMSLVALFLVWDGS